jgi:phenylacetate-coenzyme A ligase PaaK-like adenylate-forming protein
MAIEDLLHPFVGRYMGAPHWLKASAGRAYACLPERVRLGRAYGQFLDEIGVAEGREGQVRLAEAKLLRTLRCAFNTVPAYRPYRHLLAIHRDPREILARLPVVDKLDIKRNPERYISSALPASARLEMHTGGSTQNPMRFYLHKHVSRPKEYAFIHRFRTRVGAGPDDLMLALRGRTVPGAGRRGGRLWAVEPIKRQLILSSDHLERRFMPGYAEALALHRPAFVEAFPSALYPLARWLAANPLPEFTDHLRGVMLYSENVYGFQLEKFREVFRCPIVMHYGHSERVLMAASMPDDDRYFFWPQYGHFELVDSNDMPITRPGVVGFVVGTSFDNEVMPFVRYRTGDLAMLSEREHPDLPGYPVCERIMGRLQEFVVCRDRRLVSITTLGVAHFPELALVDAIQYEQDRPGHVTLKVVAESRLDAGTLERIGAAVARKTQGGCEVEVTQVDGIPRTARGKTCMLVQHLDIRRYFGAPVEEAA